MDQYQFPAQLKKHGLSVTKGKVMDDNSEIITVEIPKLTITLEFVGDQARGINAKLSAFHGQELLIVVEGAAAQLSL